MELDATPEARLTRARASLEGLSVGDTFGDQFFEIAQASLPYYFETRTLPTADPFWRYSDDTNMALSVYATLNQHQTINQDTLATSFAKYYHPSRGYGSSMHGLLNRIALGMNWRHEASKLFEGQGSHGNGAAMRVAPLGAYFADDMDLVIEQAKLSAEITHTNPEGIAGAIAVAVAAAYACRLKGQPAPTRQEFIDIVLPHIPNSIVSERLRHARELTEGSTLLLAVAALGNGRMISAQDTVPFDLWCAGETLSNYTDAMWLAAAASGDIDTNCAIVGGIVACYMGMEGIPAQWIKRRESLPSWAFEEISI